MGGFFIYSTGNHHRNHFVVAHERPERVLERRRSVFFDHKVGKPRGAVTWYECQRKKPPTTRLLHLLGTTVGLACAVYLIASGRWWLFFLGLIPGYGAAWIGHFFIEQNRPATFQHPIWSFMGDYKMIWLMLTGRMGTEVRRVAVRSREKT